KHCTSGAPAANIIEQTLGISFKTIDVYKLRCRSHDRDHVLESPEAAKNEHGENRCQTQDVRGRSL
ncbi:MAG: hypothetical protein ACUVSP_08485, partial [Desulfotomaculales bacterium]